jgi:hypothetical protein
VIGFDVKANPFVPSSVYRTSTLSIQNSTLDFYLNGQPFNQSQCTSAFFSGFKPLFENFADFGIYSDTQYPKEGICPFLIRDWSSVVFYIDVNNYPTIMNISEQANVNTVYGGVTLCTTEPQISIDNNMIDMRLITNSEILTLPYTNYSGIEAGFFQQFNNLNFLYILALNFGDMIRTTDISWLTSLNSRLANTSVDLANATSLINAYQFLVVAFGDGYNFPNEDFCLFKDFPHNRLVYAEINTPPQSCSCTLLYVLSNWLLVSPSALYLGNIKSDIACITSANITQMVQACNFSQRLLQC